MVPLEEILIPMVRSSVRQSAKVARSNFVHDVRSPNGTSDPLQSLSRETRHTLNSKLISTGPSTMKITVAALSDLIFSLEDDEELELGNFRPICDIESEIPAGEIYIVLSGESLADDTKSLKVISTFSILNLYPRSLK